MRVVKGWKLFSVLLVVSSFLFIACDKAEIDVSEKKYSIGADGGELSVLVKSTGVDEVVIPEECKAWLSVGEVVETRALPVFKEDVVLKVEPNTGKMSRKAEIVLYSFHKHVKIEIKQEGTGG